MKILQKKLEEVASDSAGKQMLEFAIAMYEKIIQTNSGHSTQTVRNTANHPKIRLLYKTADFTV